MVLKDRLTRARIILEAHNKAASEPNHTWNVSVDVDIDAFFAKLRDMGGTTEELLAEATWEDLQTCGLPRILARKIAGEFRDEDKNEHEPLQKVIIEDNDPVKQAQRLTPGELIAEYNPQYPKNPIGERLKQLAEGRKFLIFQSNDNATINVIASQQLFDELDDYGERDNFTVGGIPRKVYKVGDRPGRSVDEHPLFPGTPLRTNGCSEADCNWGTIPLKIRQIYLLAIESGELSVSKFQVPSSKSIPYHTKFQVGYREVDLHNEAATRNEEEICRLYRKAAVKWQELESIGKLPSLKVVLGGETKPKPDYETRPNRPFGQNRIT